MTTHPAVAEGRAGGVARQLRAEYRKLATLRSTAAVLAVALAVELVLRAVSVAVLPTDPAPSDVVAALKPSIAFAVSVTILPVVVATQEWRWATAFSTFALEPRRPVVLLAKAAAGGIAGLVAAAVLSGLAVALQVTVLLADGTTLPPAGRLAAVTTGPVLAGCLLGVAAVHLGLIVRSQTIAVPLLALALFVVPLPLQLLGPRAYAATPSGWTDALAGQAGSGVGLWSPGTALLGLLALAAVLGLGAHRRLDRSDVL